MVNCQKCGAKVEQGDSFCPDCGAKVIQEKVQAKPQPGKGVGIKIVGIIGIVIVYVIGITFLFRAYGKVMPVIRGEASAAAIVGFILTIIGILILILIAFYIYTALVLSAIAKRTNTENPWLAWIPVGNLYLMTQIANVPWWTLLIVLFGSTIPYIGAVASIVVSVWWWWRIAEVRNKPGWFGLLMLVPIANLIMMGILAWGD